MDIRIHSHFGTYNKLQNKNIQSKFTYISNLYYRLLKKIKVENGSKILIQVIGNGERIVNVSNGKSVPSVVITLRPSLFEKPLDYQFHSMTKEINSGLLDLAEQSKWNKKIFEDCYLKIQETGFNVRTYLSKWKNSPNKSKRGVIEVNMGYSESYISFLFEDISNGEIKSIQGFKLRGGDFFLSFYLGKKAGGWLNDFQYKWLTKNNEMELIFDVKTNTVNMTKLKPKDNVHFNMLKD